MPSVDAVESSTEQPVSFDSSIANRISDPERAAQTSGVQSAAIEVASAPTVASALASSTPANARLGPSGSQDPNLADEVTSATNSLDGAVQTGAQTIAAQSSFDTTQIASDPDVLSALDSTLTPSSHLKQTAASPLLEMPSASQTASVPALPVPSSAHAISNSPAHAGAAPRSTPLPAENTVPSTQSQAANSSLISLPIPSRSLPENENFSPAKNSNPESRFSPNAAAPSTATPTGAEHVRPTDPPSGDSADSSSSHKEPAVAANQNAGQTADTQAGSAQSSANVVGPALQASIAGTPIAGPSIAAASVIAATVPQQPAASGAARAAEGSAPADPSANPPASPELPGNASTGPVQMAQMVNQAAQSEMRIGMNTAAFGNVEVRTVVHANDVGVLIGSEKGDLRSLLTNELPGIASTLQQQNLRLSQVNFHTTGFAFSSQTSSGGDSQPRSYSSTRAVRSQESIAGPSADDSSPTWGDTSNSENGLNIIA
jgi:hypothetical protein